MEGRPAGVIADHIQAEPRPREHDIESIHSEESWTSLDNGRVDYNNVVLDALATVQQSSPQYS